MVHIQPSGQILANPFIWLTTKLHPSGAMLSVELRICNKEKLIVEKERAWRDRIMKILQELSFVWTWKEHGKSTQNYEDFIRHYQEWE